MYNKHKETELLEIIIQQYMISLLFYNLKMVSKLYLALIARYFA